MKTYSPKPEDIERRWYVIDADGAVLGRLATEVADVLRGKHKPIFAPHADTGDHVIVVNAAGVRLTGGKESKKVAYHHSGYPGGLRETGYARLMAERPAFVVEKAVRGMLPHNRLGRAMARKLSVYEGPEHPHAAQKPLPLKLGEIPKWDGLPTPKPVEAKTPPEIAEQPERKRRAPARAIAVAAKPKASQTRDKKPTKTAAKRITSAKTETKAAPKRAAAKPTQRKPRKTEES
jgi:large subunit ribosomal protein L13